MAWQFYPGETLDCRQRLCNLTKADLQQFDHILSDRFPDLFRFETSRVERRIKVYDTLAEVDREVQFCEHWPESTLQIVTRRPGTASIQRRKRAPWPPSIGILVSAPKLIDLRDVGSNDVTRPIEFVGYRFQNSYDMQGCYPRGDTQAKKFFDAVFRMSARFMTNRFEWYDLETGKYLRTQTGSLEWCGPEGVRLSKDDPNFYPLIGYSVEDGTWIGAKAIPRE